MNNFQQIQQMQMQMAEMKMRERMLEMERRGQQGGRKRGLNTRIPMVYGAIFLLILLITIGIIVVMGIMHAL